MYSTTLLLNGNPLASFGPALKRWVLWHITSNCNLECVYCYGSFNGGSYKKKYKFGTDIPTQKALEVADAIAALGYQYVHVNGGEPLLRNDIWEIVRRLTMHRLKVWLLTNATFLPKSFMENLLHAKLEALAFSLDAVDVSYNDFVRGKTQKVITNIEQVAAFKRAKGIDTLLGLYVVLTKKNLRLIADLFRWAVQIGVDYINMQAVYLPKDHPMRDELYLTEQDWPDVRNALRLLEEQRTRIHISSNVLLTLTKSLMIHRGVVAKDCFAERGDFLYISPTGDVFGCPAKPTQSNISWGNVVKRSLVEIVKTHLSMEETTAVCPYVSLDCLGMYEMAYQRDYQQLEE